MASNHPTLKVLAAALVVIVTTASLGAFAFAAFLAERRWEWQYLHSEGAAYAEGLAGSIGRPNVDPAWIDQLIESRMEMPDIHTVVVHRADPAASGGFVTYVRSRDADGNVVIAGELPPAVPAGLVVAERQLPSTAAATAAPGFVRVYMSPRAIRTDFMITLPQLIWVILALDLLLSAGLYLLLWWTVLRPLKDIERYALSVRGESQRARAPFTTPPPVYRHACRELRSLQDSIVHMVRLLQTHLAALRRNETMLSTILEAVPYCLWWKDPNGVFLGCNQAFAEAAGRRDAGEVVGKSDFDLAWPRHEAEAYRAADREVLATSQPRRHIIEPITHAGGPRRWADTTKVPLADADGVPYAVLGVAEDITERKEAEDALRREKAVNEAILNGIPGFLCLYDDRGTLVRWNAKIEEARHAFGYADDDDSGRWHVLDWIPDDEKERISSAVREVMTTGHAELEADLITRFGARIPYFHTGVRLTIEGKPYLLTISIDISQRRHAEEHLRRALQQAEDANLAKDRFLAAASHELRTPLAPVLLLASAVETDPRLPADIREDLATIREHVEVEKRLIGDLLDFTAIHAGKLHVKAEPTDVHDVLRAAVRTCQGGMERKQIRLDVHLDAQNHYTCGDPDRLRQIFWNLLQNACKFTPEHGTVSVRTCDDDGHMLRVDVADTGRGMDTETLSRLFRPFEQGPRDQRMQHYGGLGLGLAISKALVEAHNGTICASSEGPGRGSSFVVWLPVTATVPCHPPQPPPAPPGPVRLKLLLVEDHLPTLKTLNRLLSAEGHDVTTATTIAEAIHAADRDHFDLVLSDLGLPDGSGLDLMPILRDRHALSGIALTGFGAERDVDASRKAGFLTHLTKPVSMDALRDALARFAASRFHAFST